MKLQKADALKYFVMPIDLKSWLNNYPSPECEIAFAKGIPNTEYNHKIIDRLAKIIPIRRRYRGNSKPGYRRPGAFVHKSQADTIALYPKMEFGPNGYTWMGTKI